MTEEMVAPVLTEEAVRTEIPENKSSSPPENAGIKEKFYGIELLRILATFYIILLHVIGQGGIASAVGQGRIATAGCSLLLALAYPAVNCYALISGFVGCKSRFKLSRLLLLWVSVVTVNLAVWGFFRLFAPSLAAHFSLSACFKPLINNEYWYVTAYFGLSVLTPALNAAVLNLPKKDFARMLIGFFALFVLLPVIADKDLFWSHSGYSMLWLTLLYVTGAYFRLHIQPAKPGHVAGAVSLRRHFRFSRRAKANCRKTAPVRKCAQSHLYQKFFLYLRVDRPVLFGLVFLFHADKRPETSCL